MDNKLSSIGSSSIFVLRLFWKFKKRKIIIEMLLSALNQIAIVLNSVWLLHFISEEIIKGSTFRF